MKSIKVTIYGRQYPLRVNDSDVETMEEIASYVDQRFRSFKNDLANQSETTIMVMASLSLAEELFSERNKRQEAAGSEEVFEQVNHRLKQVLSDIKEQNYDISL